jgi:hypothetical protein
MWLRDFLPKKVPDARILTYGYEANVFSNSTGRMRTFAENLLEDLRTERKAATVSYTASRSCCQFGCICGAGSKQAYHLHWALYGRSYN